MWNKGKRLNLEYQPYTQQEFLEQSKIHGPFLRVLNSLGKDDAIFDYLLPIRVMKDYIILLDVEFNGNVPIENTPFKLKYEDLFEEVCWQDGCCCGKIKE